MNWVVLLESHYPLFVRLACKCSQLDKTKPVETRKPLPNILEIEVKFKGVKVPLQCSA